MSRPSGAGAKMQKQDGVLHIFRHREGEESTYTVMFSRLAGGDADWTPWHVASANDLIDLLEQLGVDFRDPAVKEALERILRQGSASLAGIRLSDEELAQKGLPSQRAV